MSANNNNADKQVADAAAAAATPAAGATAAKPPRSSESGAGKERRKSENKAPRQHRQSTKEGDSNGASRPNGGASANGSGPLKDNRQRPRTSTRGDESSPSLDRKDGGSKNNRDSVSGNPRKKEWSERKSYSQGKERNGHNGEKKDNGEKDDKKRTRSTNSNSGQKGRLAKASTTSVNSNGEGLDYGNYEDLDEPFSDSDEESPRHREPQKMQLPIPRGRIRTLSGTVPVVGFSPKWGGPTMCLSCLQFFDLPEDLEKFTSHLLSEHHIVVSEMGLIVDPKRYIEHWRQRFAKESIDNIFPRVEVDEQNPHHGKTEYYYEMSAALQEDFQVRQRLAMRRLEEALLCQQREREDANFTQQCIFCRYTARGNRSKIIHHLYMIHHLNLGSPDNLVFVTEYIEHLKEKLVRNECIYCEKIFGDRNMLMDHMRKRNHREVNPRNHYYDKFYIINYLELGKRWLDVLAEDFEDTMPTFADSDEEEEDNEWCEWQEDNVEDETRVLCLCCEETTDCAAALLDHMKEKHGLDLMKEIGEHKLGTYERAKLINHVRKLNYNSTCWVCGKAELGNWMAVYRHIEENHKPVSLPDRSTWDTEEDLVPLFGNDHFIWMLESLIDAGTDKDSGKTSPTVDVDAIAKLVAQSKINTVEGVIAEDMPDIPALEDIDQIF
ncbi:hypothetical protein PFISCL1PPCAC_2644 [Pristionchus fissidentatus]|uniref:C2H2-type domain-containing protein n=1 Tax=Pristionchus fissidentatus TaxID=1538716 RepID=A0AAV5UVQ0_9BILA|nr:hypothetical protein PFISCL1PPCAC_2644 [Pristionchus fissidentatus]